MTLKKAPSTKTKLKTLVDVGKSTSRVLGSVERWLLAQPEDKSRSTVVIHPSAMIKDDWCHRAQYFWLAGEDPGPRNLTMKQHMVFGLGHDIHDRWQGWFSGMGKMYGTWQCTECKYKWEALSADLSRCPACASVKGIEYREVPVYSPAHRISGHADGWLKGLGEDLLLEIKSVGDGTIRWEDPGMWYEAGQDFNVAWSAIKAPFYGHIMQAQVYMKLLEMMNPEDYPKAAVFIYENKLNQSVKEFIVPKSDFGISHLFDAAAMIVDCLDKGEPPSCNVNASGTCKKCEIYK